MPQKLWWRTGGAPEAEVADQNPRESYQNTLRLTVHCLAGKESTCNAGDLGSIPGLGRSPAEGKGYPLQYSGLENSMNCTVHGITKSQTRLSDLTHKILTSAIQLLGLQLLLKKSVF